MLREWPARPTYMAGGSRVQMYKEPLQRGQGRFQRPKKSDLWKNTGRQTVFEVGGFRNGLMGPPPASAGGALGPPSPGLLFERCAAGEDAIGLIHMLSKYTQAI